MAGAVKPEPPSEVQVANMEGFYNVTWNHVNQEDCLTYEVRIREAKKSSTVTCGDKPQEHGHAMLLTLALLGTGAGLFLFLVHEVPAPESREAAATSPLDH